MAMLETAYALKDEAQVLVASQDLEPGDGWRYDDWILTLTQHPDSDAFGLGKIIVDSYQRTYGDPAAPSSAPETTLSAVDLSRISALAKSVDTLSVAFSGQIATLIPVISQARKASPVYAPNAYGDNKQYFFHVDLGKFSDELFARVASNPTLRQQISDVRNNLKASIIETYAGSARTGFGSNGLCIYFPANLSEYQNDVFSEHGYDKNNAKWPVAFVQDIHWTDFLHAYYQKAGNDDVPPAVTH
jgi:hypothetical protein